MLIGTSVAHTGSVFLLEDLLADLVRVDEPTDDGGFFFRHIGFEHAALIRSYAKQYPCIVPMRHPMKVALSYKKRRESLQDMLDGFRRLVTAIDPLNPYYLPLDVPDRQDWLDRINNDLNLDLQTNWQARNVCSGSGRLCDTELAWVEGLMDELSEFFGRFGYAV